MRLTVLLFAGLRERAGCDRFELAGLPEDLDVAGLKRILAERFPAWGDLASVRGVLEESYVSDHTPLLPDQEVALLPPVSGGSPRDEDLENGVFELSADPLVPQADQERVAHPSCGAIVCFTGMTREVNRERTVERLDYETFGSMAQREMAAIFAACRERFGPPSASGEEEPGARRLRMLVRHRTGTVGVGQASVVVCVASPHRDGAFSAARFLIDELKERVPLWKKEVYADGHHWIGERS